MPMECLPYTNAYGMSTPYNKLNSKNSLALYPAKRK